MKTRTSVREARAGLSRILASGETVAVGDPYRSLRGFIVGIPPHHGYRLDERRKALKHAKAKFAKAWIAEHQQ